MLPLYHRQHDARQILLCIPASLALWVGGRKADRWALMLTTGSIFLLSDLGAALRIGLIEPWIKVQTGWWGKFVTILFGRPAQLSLFLLGVYLLWLYAGRAWSARRLILPEAVR